MKILFFFVDKINVVLAFFACIVLFLMMLNVAIDVLLQIVFGTPLPLTLEVVSYYYMLVVAFIPLAMVERKGGHIKVDLLVQFFPPMLQRLIDATMALAGAAFFGLVAWVTLQEALRRYEFGEYVMGTYPMLVWPARFTLPIGLGLFALVLAIKGVFLLCGRQPPPFRSGIESGNEAVAAEEARR